MLRKLAGPRIKCGVTWCKGLFEVPTIVFFLSALLLTACQRQGERIDASQYDAYWLWAGVKPQPVLDRAKTIYLLEGEIRAGDPSRIHSLRPGTPRIKHADIWLVYRVETLNWGPDVLPRIQADLARWRQANPRAVGVQIDFDAATRSLEGYAAFLKKLRADLPSDAKLGITGLMDWSSRIDPGGLKAIVPIVDEIIIQTYQGRKTIPGYTGYLSQLDRLDIPYKLGLVQHGQWSPPAALKNDPYFKGYVVFLLNPDGAT
jgi:Protein of unknown function (DUF3142)